MKILNLLLGGVLTSTIILIGWMGALGLEIQSWGWFFAGLLVNVLGTTALHRWGIYTGTNLSSKTIDDAAKELMESVDREMSELTEVFKSAESYINLLEVENKRLLKEKTNV